MCSRGYAYERELGMTPASRIALRVDDSRARSLDVAAELAELHRERQGVTSKGGADEEGQPPSGRTCGAG